MLNGCEAKECEVEHEKVGRRKTNVDIKYAISSVRTAPLTLLMSSVWHLVLSPALPPSPSPSARPPPALPPSPSALPHSPSALLPSSFSLCPSSFFLLLLPFLLLPLPFLLLPFPLLPFLLLPFLLLPLPFHLLRTLSLDPFTGSLLLQRLPMFAYHPMMTDFFGNVERMSSQRV
ncbi:uncharacterized protein FA14DRAFT_72755 [Meira miltonrushii]|uniref:Uncharacterized protein n=1 Tax=Meira miltonrushii TaxID=1280837 RepID=A0A316VBH7_9BASI|nr:uncharacterized protein FA14DRAFT_72755 [Meira miltonrushii]PWN34458.1 hypothetical protein FA14DRAFT_72755 [Meira miltonrushii]